MSWILDIAVVALIALFVWFGVRNGLVKTLVKLVGCVLALVLAATLSTPLAEAGYDLFVADRVDALLMESVSITEGGSVREDIEQTISGLPGLVQNAIENAGFLDRAVDSFEDAVAYKEVEIATVIARDIVRPVGVALLSVPVFLLVFIALMLAVSLLAKVLSVILKLPVLKQLNGLLGGLLGLLEGMLIAFVLVAVLQMVAASSSEEAVLNPAVIENSTVVSLLAENNPVAEHWNMVEK